MTKKHLYIPELNKTSTKSLKKILSRYKVRSFASVRIQSDGEKKSIKTKFQFYKERLKQTYRCFFRRPHAFLMWGSKAPSSFINALSKRLHIPIIYFEPIFTPPSLKSYHPGQGYKLNKAYSTNLPVGGIIDIAHRYYNTPHSSRTVAILNNHDFDQEIQNRGSTAIDLLIKSQILSELIPQPETPHTHHDCILILGQREHEMSLNKGTGFSFNSLVRTAAREHPNKSIVYFPAEELIGLNENEPNHPIHVSHLCTVKTSYEDLYHYLNDTTTVYVHSHFFGFDFLIRGAKIITYGAPFYAGWGLSEDRTLNKPRKRQLKVSELVAGVFFIAARYYDPESKKNVPFEDMIQKIIEMQNNIKAVELTNFGDESRKDQNYIAAESYYKRALELQTNNGFLHWKIGTTLNNQGRYLDATEHFEKAVEINPKIALWRFDLSKTWQRTGKYNEQIKIGYKEAVRLTKHKNFKYLSALINHKWVTEGISRNLLELLKKSVKNNNFVTPGILLKYAAILNEAGFTSDALMRYKQAIKLKPSCIDQRRYLALKAMITSVEPRIHGASPYERDTFNKYKSQQGRFKQLIQKHNDDFCVIGNSPCELGKNQGDTIDKHGLIIRFNNFATDYPYCKDYGKKTNIWVKTTNFVDVKRRDLSDFEHILLSSANIENTGSQGTSDIFEFMELGKTVEAYPQQIVLEVISKLKTPPSAGILLLYWIYKLTGPIDRKHVYGFSFTDQGRGESSHYFEKSTNHGYRHNWDSEKSFFETLLK